MIEVDNLTPEELKLKFYCILVAWHSDRFTPAEFEFDMSYDGLNMADKGHLIEHLAPLGFDFWGSANHMVGVTTRIYYVHDAVQLACLNTK